MQVQHICRGVHHLLRLEGPPVPVRERLAAGEFDAQDLAAQVAEGTREAEPCKGRQDLWVHHASGLEPGGGGQERQIVAPGMHQQRNSAQRSTQGLQVDVGLRVHHPYLAVGPAKLHQQ